MSEKSPCSLPEAAMNDLEMLYPVNGTDCFSEIAQNYQINEAKLKVIKLSSAWYTWGRQKRLWDL